MRILLLLLGLFCCLNLQAREITILAKVKNSTTKEMGFSFTVDALAEESKLTVANLNERNEVYFILDFKGENIVTVDYNGYYFDIFIENENRIEFEFDGKNIINTIKFTGEGAANNNALATFRKQFEGNGKTVKYNKGYLTCQLIETNVNNAKTQSLTSYEKGITKKHEDKLKFIESKQDISTAFKTYMNKKITYGTGTARLTYFIANETSVNSQDIKTAEIRHRFRHTKQENSALKHADYSNFWIAYVYFNYLGNTYTESNSGFGFYEVANKELLSETKDWVLAKILINAKKENYPALGEKKFATFKENASNSSYVDKVAKVYEDIIEVTDEGGAAPEFILQDTDGRLRSLSEFEGKVVYISYWATWCKPCLMGFRKTIAVREQMQDLGVVLLNVCLDENETTWLGTMARIPMPGINLYAGNNEELKLNYDLSKLPSYYIIDKNGNFAYLPEGSRDILAEFKKMVNE